MTAISYEKIVRSGKFTLHDFQDVDLQQLTERSYSANWSEMGCFKTTTAEYLLQRRLEHVQNPRVLIITTKSGKGAYYETLNEVMPDWEVYTVGTTKTNLVINGNPMPFNVDLPMPTDKGKVIVIAHYHCFTHNACIPQPIRHHPTCGVFEEEGACDCKNPKFNDKKELNPIYRNEDGTIPHKVPRLAILMAHYWDAVILDEAHRIKNPDAQWSTNIKRLGKKVGTKHIMTGTGFINDPSEIHNLLDFLGGRELVPAKNKFAKDYCSLGYGNVVIGIRPEMKEQFRNLTRQVGVRRTLQETHPHIHEPLVTKVGIDLNPTQRKMYDSLIQELRLLDQEGVPLYAANVLVLLNRLRQVTVATPKVLSDYYDKDLQRRVTKIELVEPSSKLDALMELIEGLRWDTVWDADEDGNEARQQLVVFSNFKDPINLACKRFDKAHIPYIRMDASDTEQTRYHKWHELWTQKKHQVFICTLQLGSESINLSSAQRCVFLDRSWSPKDNALGVGRVYRPGQTGVTQVIHIEAFHTTDQYIESKVARKQGWFTEIFGNIEED